MDMNTVAIVHEDGKPIRMWVGEKCLYNAYKWAHHYFCLADGLDGKVYLPHQLPDWLKITFHLMSNEDITKVIGE